MLWMIYWSSFQGHWSPTRATSSAFCSPTSHEPLRHIRTLAKHLLAVQIAPKMLHHLIIDFPYFGKKRVQTRFIVSIGHPFYLGVHQQCKFVSIFSSSVTCQLFRFRLLRREFGFSTDSCPNVWQKQECGDLSCFGPFPTIVPLIFLPSYAPVISLEARGVRKS